MQLIMDGVPEPAGMTGAATGMIALPPVLRRCEVTGAQVAGDELSVAFVPDPAVWLR